MYYYDVPDKNNIVKTVPTLTPKEIMVYKALVSCWNGSGNDDDDEVRELQTDLEQARKITKLSPSSYAGVIGGLAKKKLYQQMRWWGKDAPYKTVVINGQEEKVHSEIGYVFCTQEFFKINYGE